MKKLVSAILLCGLLAFSAPLLAGPVNVNEADAATLAAELKGIGMKTAEKIIAYRDQHGPFRSLADLRKVKGVGGKVLESNEDNILFE